MESGCERKEQVSVVPLYAMPPVAESVPEEYPDTMDSGCERKAQVSVVPLYAMPPVGKWVPEVVVLAEVVVPPLQLVDTTVVEWMPVLRELEVLPRSEMLLAGTIATVGPRMITARPLSLSCQVVCGRQVVGQEVFDADG